MVIGLIFIAWILFGLWFAIPAAMAAGTFLAWFVVALMIGLLAVVLWMFAVYAIPGFAKPSKQEDRDI